jgi:hypothetical protein
MLVSPYAVSNLAIMQGSAKTEADLAKASGDNKLLRLFFG